MKNNTRVAKCQDNKTETYTDQRFNKQAKQMYDLYLSGHSLAKVGKSYGVTRQSVYELFKNRGYKLRSKPKPLRFLFFNGEKYTLRNNGYYGKTRGRRSLMHRDVWEHYKGKIPEGWDIHHINEEKTDNRIENLECLTKAEHTRKYSPHNNQYTKGSRK